MTESVLELQNVTKRYGDFTAVDDVSFSIPPGTIYGFLGPNGAGKTTTIRMILDIIRPTSGSIAVFGAPSALDVRHRIGYLPEEKGLYKKMKAASIIAYFATLKGLSRKDAKERAHELLERYGLGSFAKSKCEALSKGMGQKVQVLASIAHDPDLAILDEPFSGLDPVNQQVLEEIVLDLAKRGKTVIFSTHVMQHAERICDRILLIAKGKKVFDGTVPEAKNTIARRIRIETPDDIEKLKGVSGVTGIHATDRDGVRLTTGQAQGDFWELECTESVDTEEVLKACFDRGVRLRRFDRSDPSLHEVFVQLVGDDAREAAYR
ncbi:MAG: ATP-binding cassette domain-containing protein [Planctomycetota bacterium]